MFSLRTALVGGIGVLAALGQAQSVNHMKQPTVPTMAEAVSGPGLHLTSNLGSFKIKRGAEIPDIGKLDIAFHGTVLISGLKGSVTPTGAVRLEYTNKPHQKQVFFGKGTLHVEGEFNGIQFFGTDLNALYKGTGLIQMFGEFDKDLNTGFYWYGNDTANKRFWGTGGMIVTPSPVAGQGQNEVKVKIKNETTKP